jgi:two-component system, NarL family, response regulator
LPSPKELSKTDTLLTYGEQEILALITTEKSNPEIAAALYITPDTVRVYVHSILDKLGVHDRTQLSLLPSTNN